ncbi:diguanylate cyclase domain-containing protein [Umezawaea endophytica]|uniref:Diguanylate cyclase n=1 Tax=Umezawaea endophytica TaxID=1654476 RepID=A0A9X2VTJ4_9PSEU|nr:diguanylate cyclase [Umezawaea endophytica]MCS7481869.1 diguanylate cyclase [Umezawaea endophytica]
MSKIPGATQPSDGPPPPEVGPAHPTPGERWTKALARTAYSPTSRRKIRRDVDAHVAALVALLKAPDFTAEPAHAIGAWLVAARYTGQRSLQTTVDVLGPALRTHPELLGVPNLADRVVFVLGALAAGYANAVREQIFEEQERVRNSLLLTLGETQQNLHDSEARFRQVFSSSAVGIAILDLAGNLVEANPALAHMLGHQVDAPDEVFAPADLLALRESSHGLLEAMEEDAKSERRFTGPAGDEIWANVVLSVVRDSDEQPKYFVAVMEDVTDERQLWEYLRFQALHDVLTGLPNWQSFLPHLEKVLGKLRSPHTVTLCYLDVDSLALVNDGVGYQAGDRLLTAVAHRLTAVVAGETAMVARAGGDEFVVLIEDSPAAPSISEWAARFDASLAEPVAVDSTRTTAVSAGMGFVRTSASGVDALALVRQAHSTLRRAEAKGKRQWAYYDRDQDDLDRPRLELVATLPGALAAGDVYTEFESVDGVVLAARLRWELQDDTVVAHDEVLRLGDELGHTIPLGNALLEQACARAADPDEHLPVLVRLSPDHSRDPDLTAVVGRALSTTGLEPHRLWLSLSLRGLDNEEGQDNLSVLADLGVKVLLHDLSGSVTELSTVEFGRPHAVALAPVPDSPLARATTTALVPLLRAAGALVIADGTTAEQDDWFRSIGVDLLLPDQPAADEY